MFQFFSNDVKTKVESVVGKIVNQDGTFYKVRNGLYEEFFMPEEEVVRKHEDLLTVFEACRKRVRSSPPTKSKLRVWEPVMKKRRVTVRLYTSTTPKLNNLGNTCFLNSTLQALFCSKNFCERIMNEKCHSDFAFMVQLLLKNVVSNPGEIFSPTDICSALQKSTQLFRKNQQHDAQDCLRKVIEKLGHGVKNTCQLDMSSFVRCRQCQNVKETKFVETDLSVPINYVKIAHCVEDFFRIEKLQGGNQYFCQCCNANVNALKKLRINRFPNVMLVQVKRFAVNMRNFRPFKINEKVELSDKLRFRVDASHNNNNEHVVYTLVGIICHVGTQERGHYYTYIRKLSVYMDSWEDKSDLRFKRDQFFTRVNGNVFGNEGSIPLSEISKMSPYILVYEKN